MTGPILRKYGVSATIPFKLIEIDGVDFRVDAVYAAGDVTDIPFQQIVMAAGQGTCALLSSVSYLNKLK